MQILIGNSYANEDEKLEYEDIEKNNRNKTPRILCMMGDIYLQKKPQQAL